MFNLEIKECYKIRDSIDVYLIAEETICVYFLSTRQRKTFKVSEPIVKLFEMLDGKEPLVSILSRVAQRFDLSVESFYPILKKMFQLKILSKVDSLSEAYVRYDRQFNYFSDFFMDMRNVEAAQKKLFNVRVVIFGCGAVGGDIAILLAMAGVRNFLLVDDDIIKSSDATRHMYYKSSYEGMKKNSALAREILNIEHKSKIEEIDLRLNPNTDISVILQKVDFVINTMDEPYIGYTSAKISRACFCLGIPHYIAGGFDAHLASTGELIVPHITPCVECYANHFKKTLAGWKPRKHPVEKRHDEIGGTAAMSLFSASYAVINIIKYLCGLQSIERVAMPRGELLVGDMSLTYLDVSRNPNCPVCGG